MCSDREPVAALIADVLLVQGTSEAILRMRAELGLAVREAVQVGPLKLTSFDVQLVEAVIPAGSPLAGRTLAESDFRALYNLNVLGISKHGSVRPLQVTSTHMDVGDTLLIQGHTRDIERARPLASTVPRGLDKRWEVSAPLRPCGRLRRPGPGLRAAARSPLSSSAGPRRAMMAASSRDSGRCTRPQ